MKGIKITQEIKNKNARYNLNFVKNNDVDAIVAKNPPNKFYVTEPVSGGYYNRTDLHSADGFKEIVTPSYNNRTEKLGGLIDSDDNLTFTYEIISLNQQEQDDLTVVAEANEARDEAEKYVEKGLSLNAALVAKFYRRVVLYPNGLNAITKSQVGKMNRWFKDAKVLLSLGDFREAEKEIASVITQRTAILNTDLNEAPGMLDAANWYYNQVKDYFDNKYKL